MKSPKSLITGTESRGTRSPGCRTGVDGWPGQIPGLMTINFAGIKEESTMAGRYAKLWPKIRFTADGFSQRVQRILGK